MAVGNVAIVLNAHFPYVRRAGHWPHGEEALHEVIAESYVPFVRMLHDLRASGLAAPLTLAISPVLLDQLADPVVTKHYLNWVTEWRARASADLARFEAQDHPHGAYLARFYIDWIGSIERTFVDRFGRNLAGALRSSLGDTIELLLAPATYAYLPHLHPCAVHAQLEAGALDLVRLLGRRPKGLWLPGGGRPSGSEQPIGELQLQYAVGAPGEHTAAEFHGWGLPLIRPDQILAEHVTTSAVGYPGDNLYREFHRRHDASGIAYWRVTGDDAPIAGKDWYDPYLAFSRAHEHAAHFVQVVRDRLRAQATRYTNPAAVVAFDAELFGHWWFEGMHWLQAVLTRLLSASDVRLVTLSEIHRMLPQNDVPSAVDTPHPIFDAPIADALRRQVQQATKRFIKLARQRPAAEGLEEALLSQAARELLLVQSSDWLALIVTETADDYAERRVIEHLSRFDRLLQYVEQHACSADAEAYLGEVAELDNPFPYINYRMFC